jgi:hypothetical protein
MAVMTQAELLPALTFEPATLHFDFATLEARITDITETYTGLVVQEDDVPAIKSEMAALNRLKDQLAAARKDAIAKVSEPIRIFDERIRALEQRITDTRTFLDDQVKAHLQRERDGRRARVQGTIDILKDEHGCPGLDIPIQESWLNKTAKSKDIAAQVQAIILAHKKAEADAAAAEQAKKDRIVAIEQHCKAMEATRDYTLPFSRFAGLCDPSIPLDAAITQISMFYGIEDKHRAPKPPVVTVTPEQAPMPPLREPEPAHWTDPPKPAPEPERPQEVRKTMTITATYDASRGKEINVLYQRLRSLCLTCDAKVTTLEPLETAVERVNCPLLVSFDEQTVETYRCAKCESRKGCPSWY